MRNKIYYHGDIITMEENSTEAVLIQNGKIGKLGTLKQLQELDQTAQLVDLKGHTLMPGFIDSHSHLTALAQVIGLVPLQKCKSIEDITQKMKQADIQYKNKPGEWIVGFGYDHNFLQEKRHLLKDDLDKIESQNPMIVVHTSGHMGSVNSIGLKQLGLTNQTKDPVGGSYGRENGSTELNGYLEENAFILNTKEMLKKTPEQMAELIEKAQEIYLQNGITTVQDGLTKQDSFSFLDYMANTKRLKVDVVSYIDIKEKEILEKNRKYQNQYHNRLKIGGYKQILDGSPQGKTAWLKKPYEGESQYCGYPAYSKEKVKRNVETAYCDTMQILSHCNGDGAAEQLIEVIDQIQKGEDCGKRPVMIHAQIVTKEQIRKMKKLGIIPSFFIAHTYYWGDIHFTNLGKERAEFISPANSAKKEGVVYTFHQDSPVIMPNMLETIWCAANRITKKGVVLGKQEKLEVLDCLKAVTINSAFQYFEEKEKGSIKEGKVADLVILDQNPLKVDKEEIKKLKVLETIKEGITVFQV